ncbi:MAG: T9SS type A sorting domain-containing protein [Flavobacteriales bacterium]|nr:T9SS type A sorting domain-containing protein [Flavobacteriales bacterium]
MKTLYSLTVFFVALCGSGSLLAQITDIVNNQVNFEFRVNDSYYGGGSDFDGQADPTIRTDLWVGGWFGELCTTWDCSPNCYSDAASWVWYAGTGYAFNAEFGIWIEAFESDNSNECSYTSGDDHYFVGMATLRDNQQYIPLVYPSSDFRPCHWNPWLAANGSPWCFQQVSEWDQIWAQTWRYTHGDAENDKLNFGTIASGATKSDINSTNTVSVGSGAPLQYTNSGGQASADVWYQFTIDQTSLVTISTIHGETDFDTYLSLFGPSGLITENDDAAGTYQSMIASTLCAGTYSIRAEGYNSNLGEFKISVNVQGSAAIAVADLGIDLPSCGDATDGYVGWFMDNGVGPYSFYWQGSSISSPSVSNLGVGTYVIEVYDACGSYTSQEVTLTNGDVTPPVADCIFSVDIEIPEGESVFLDFDDLNDSSSDNCGITEYVISPSQLWYTDAGANDVQVQLYDEAGNTSTCTTTVYVTAVVGVEELQEAAGFTIYPNPNNGQFTVDLSDLNLTDNYEMLIYNSLGQIVSRMAIIESMVQLEGLNLTDGMYTMVVQSSNDRRSERFTVRR